MFDCRFSNFQQKDTLGIPQLDQRSIDLEMREIGDQQYSKEHKYWGYPNWIREALIWK
jgi:hypothetical protein